MKLIKGLLSCLLIMFTGFGFAQSKINPNDIKDKMQWFAAAKLGIFIHAGIHSVDGIDVPATVLDKYVTVLKLKLDKPVKLYRGQGGFD